MWPLLVVATAMLGCRPRTIDTVQPGAVAKSAFDGEWFWRRTVTEVPYGTSSTFAGATDELERIVWQIEEDVLLGYRSYPNVDATVEVSKNGHYGAPLLVFPIEKHFDIRRDYDRRTGEEGNVIVENTEASWTDREYLRVDWSQNLADVRFSVAGLDASVLGYASTDGASAPVFDDSDADGIIDSMLVDQRVLLEPDTTRLPGFGDVPVCLFYGQAQVECAASEVTVRHSFIRTEGRAAVEGLAYNDRFMETFGYFLSDRLAFDPAYGLVHPNRTRYANRHPLFAQTYQTDELGRMLCQGAGMTAPCDTMTADQEPRVLELAVSDRPVRPIVYHAGPGFPADLIEPMQRVAEEWNRPLADSINGLRYWDCIDRGRRERVCEGLRDPDLQAFVFCPNNPSLPTDPAVCNTDHTGPEHRPDGVPDKVQLGDLRYSIAHVFTEPQLSSPFGYGPSAADPLGSVLPLADGARLGLGAGEIVSGTAFVYGHVLERVSHQVADLVQLLNGELDPTTFIDGEDVTAWVEAQRTGSATSLSQTASGDGSGPAWSTDRVTARLNRISNGLAPQFASLHDLPRPTTPAEMQTFLAQASQVMQQSGSFGAGQAGAHRALDRLIESDLTEVMWNAETIGLHGFDPTAVAPEELAEHRPLDLLDPDRVAEREAGRVLAGQHAVDFHDDAAFADSTLIGLAKDYQDRGLSYDEIVADVRRELFVEVMLHEVGHTLGLRHNFAASFDALNYRPEYWELRQLDGTVAPRHVDPESPAELEGGIRQYQYSSVMDYHGSSATGWAGLGHYDEAAVKFGYAGLVEVFDQVPARPAVDGIPNEVALIYWAAFNDSNLFPSPVLTRTSDNSFIPMHYTQLPDIVGDFEARVDVPIDWLAPVLSDTVSFSEGLAVNRNEGGAPFGAPAVPYRFCSDEFAVGVTCARFDQGADPYESHQFLFERYANDYVLRNFARQRYGFGNTPAYVSRLHDRTFEPLRTWQRYYALFHGIFDVEGDPLAADFFADDIGFGGWTAATDDSFRFLVQTVTRPEPGPHGLTERPDGVEMYTPLVGGELNVELIDGAYYESEWDFSSGYHWFERQSRIGSYFDRMLALMTLTNTASYNFIGYDTSIDPRAYAIGFQDLYRDPLALVLGELMADEADRLAPIMTHTGLMYPDPLDPTLAWPPTNASVVQPAAYWLVQYDAGLFGKALLSHGYDRSFINRSRLFVEGTGDAVEPGPGQATVSFDDPVSGKTWVAWSAPWLGDDGEPVLDADGAPIELGSSARLLLKAQRVAERCETEPAACTELQRISADLDLHLAAYRAFDAAP
ncbi:MAG: zinc-dependent metalloprotease [Myxococcota bacterium]